MNEIEAKTIEIIKNSKCITVNEKSLGFFYAGVLAAATCGGTEELQEMLARGEEHIKGICNDN